MSQKRLKPAPLATGTGLGIHSLAACGSENNPPLPQIQEKWLAARFRLDADRARLVAGLAFMEVLR